MIKVAKYSTIESAKEASALLAENGIETKIHDSTSNARSWSPHGSSVMGDYWILGYKKDETRIKELLKTESGNPKKVKELSKQFERNALIYLAAIAFASTVLSLTPVFETGEAIATSIALVTLITWLLNKRKTKQNQALQTTSASARRLS